MKHVVILGSTGSIGESALAVCRALPGRMQVVGLAAGRQWEQVVAQAREFGVRTIALSDPAAVTACRAAAPTGITVLAGEAGVCELAALPEANLVLCAIVGMAGLKPVLAAVTAGKHVALATKEVLVTAGEYVTRLCREKNVKLLPVDSEHSAIIQCMNGRYGEASLQVDPQAPASWPVGPHIRRLWLTASGGPFARRHDVNFDHVTVEEALNHPRWDMGPKVTIDSATMMNKGLEVMEAHWLFGVPVDRISVVLHPQSIVHSMIEFQDGVLLGQMSRPDMRFAIQYAMTYPEHMDGALPVTNPCAMGPLTFSEPDFQRFPCLDLAREAARRGGTMPAVLNAANEVAVGRFLDRNIRFSDIWRCVERVMNCHQVVAHPDLDAVLQADAWAREIAGRED